MRRTSPVLRDKCHCKDRPCKWEKTRSFNVRVVNCSIFVQRVDRHIPNRPAPNGPAPNEQNDLPLSPVLFRRYLARIEEPSESSLISMATCPVHAIGHRYSRTYPLFHCPAGWDHRLWTRREIRSSERMSHGLHYVLISLVYRGISMESNRPRRTMTMQIRISSCNM